MQHIIGVDEGIELWVEELGAPAKPPLLLIMGANAPGITWPARLVQRLGEHHRVVRYDHRDTGKSTHAFDERPYSISTLAEDAIRIMDALAIEQAHVVGMSLGGTLVQLLLLDHPDRLLSATMFATGALGAGRAAAGDESPPDLPGPDPRLLELWKDFGVPRAREDEIDFRVAHWRLLQGEVLPFDEREFRALEEAIIQHTGSHGNPTAHALADQRGLERGHELGRVRTPVLVIEAPEDPTYPPPHAAWLASRIPGSRLITIPGMGHALSGPVLDPLADAILEHTLAHAP